MTNVDNAAVELQLAEVDGGPLGVFVAIKLSV
jgi:hypothetical protein